MPRRALVLGFALLLLLALLAWLGRGGLAPERPEGVTEPGGVDPRFSCTLEAIPPTPAVGEAFRLRLSLRGDVALNEEEGSLLLGFPHPYYALRPAASGEPYPPTPPTDLSARTVGGSLDVSIRRVGHGRWYVEVPLSKSIAAGRPIELDISGLRAPNRPLDRFEPLLLLDPNGDEDFWRVCPELSVPIAAGPPHHLRAVVPSRVAPGDTIEVLLRQEDAFGNAVGNVPEAPTFRWAWPWGRVQSVEAALETVQERPGIARGTMAAPPEGVWTLGVFDGELRGGSNPILVEPDPTNVGWTDLHGHGALGDGWGLPAEWLQAARDVGLDAAALSENAWQLGPGELATLLDATDAANAPPTFVTVPALELNRVGHEIAYVFDPALLDRSAAASGGATELWAEADIGYPAATFPPLDAILGDPSVELITHSSIAPSMGTAFPLKTPLPNQHAIEVHSAHGSSECQDCPRSAWHPPKGDDGGWGSVRDALASGSRFGFLAGGNSYDGRPGASRWGGQDGGLGAVFWPSRDRTGLQQAIRHRQTYATTGRRTILDFEVDGVSMGGEVSEAPSHTIRFRVLDPGQVLRATVVRNGIDWKTVEGPTFWEEVVDPEPGVTSYYLRAEILEGGHLAWSSPVYVSSGPRPE